MTFRKTLPALLVLLFCFGMQAAHADDASRKAKVEQLFQLTHLDQTYAQLLTQMLAQSDQVTKDIFPAGATTDTQKKEMADFKSRATGLVTDAFSWANLEPDYVKLYMSVYTESELDGMIAFYTSPVGQAMLEKTPQLMKASSGIAMDRMATIEPKMQQLMEDFKKQVQADQGSSSDKVH